MVMGMMVSRLFYNTHPSDVQVLCQKTYCISPYTLCEKNDEECRKYFNCVSYNIEQL